MLELASAAHRRHPPVPRHARAQPHRPRRRRPRRPRGQRAGRRAGDRPDHGPGRRPCHLATYLGLPNYSNNWMRLGFTHDDVADGGSDRLVDALVVWGDEATIAARVQEHRDAGASHVCIQVLDGAPRDLPARAVARPRSRAHVTVRLRPLPALRRADGLAAAARRRPPRPRRRRVVRHQPRGPGPVARHRHRLADRAARHQAGPLGRRQHPRRRADGHGRRLRAAPAPRRRPRRRRPHRRRGAAPRARSTSCPGSTPTAPSGPSPTRPGSAGRAPGRGRGPTPTAGPASTSRTPTATGASCRCASSTPTARGCRTPTTPACSCPCRRPGRRSTPPLPAARRGHDRRPRRLHDPDAPPARGARPQPQLPGRVGHRCARVAATTRCRSRRSTPSCGPSSPAPTCAATTPSTPAAACCCARRRRSPTRPCRRATCGRGSSSARSAPRLTGYPVHSVYEDFTWDKADTMSGAADDWAYEHLGVYSWTTEFWDAIHAATGTEAVDRLLVRSARPTSRRWPCCAGPTSTPRASSSTGTRSSTRSSAPSSWAAGTTSGSGRTRRSTCSRPRSRRTPRSPSPRPWPRRAWRSATSRPSTSAAGTWRDRGRASPTPAGCRRTCRRGPPKRRPGAPDRRRGHRRGRRRRRRPGPPAARPARRPRHDALHYGHDGTPDRALATWVVRAEAGHRGRRSPSATTAAGDGSQVTVARRRRIHDFSRSAIR